MTTIAKAPRSSQIDTPEHIVQFYQTDGFLLDAVCAYMREGLAAGDAGVVIATQAHRESLARHLMVNEVDISELRAAGAYVELDAAETLSRFMVDGRPEPRRFARVAGEVIARAARGGRSIRVFGEMVALLWAQGNQAAAIQLEALWNERQHTAHPFALFCAYPMHPFVGEAHGAEFAAICGQHSRVVPDETYSALTSPDEQLRVISRLQQKASSLEAEIVERRATEQRLRESEARFREMAESLPQIIFTARPNGEVDYFNPQCMQFTGLPFEALRGKGWLQVVHPDESAELVRAWQQALDTGEPIYFEHRIRRADGTYRWHVCRALPTRDAAGHIAAWMGSATDIDEQKRLEERKDAFIGMASHELKTPVTSLKGFTQVLQRRLRPQADAKTLLFLDRMDAQLNKLTSLIGDLLDVSKMQSGTLAFRMTRFDLDDLVRETVENVQASTTSHRLSVRGAIHAEVSGDRDRLGQVLINLLTNAIKYSPQADMVTVHVADDGEQAEVAVQDFGIGIAPAHHERIFERFYQIAESQESVYPGLGIGLYIARTIVQRHGGRLWLESQPGAGSTFHFTLPLQREDPDAAPLDMRGNAAK